MTNRLRWLRWALNNRVLATPVTTNEVGFFWAGDWLQVRGELRRVWNADLGALVLYVY